jgi:hypothetical protein|tara:strand:- start:1376 stop:1708 length:333 start_codon:yes stop_codon:yes gene_type:complete
LAGLVKKVDSLVEKNAGKQMKSFVVLLTDDPDGAEKELQAFAKKHGISNVPLTFYEGIAGPPNYKIAKDADVTVMLWRNLRVSANHSYAKGALNSKTAQKVLDSTSKILN